MSTTLVPVDRIRNGQPAAAEIVATYQDTGVGLPVLTICSGWRPRLNAWRAEDVYRVEEVPTPLGRGFVLHRSEQAIAKDGPDADTFYAVLIGNPQDFTCTCMGFQRHGHCKHHDALRGLLESGHIDRPEADRPQVANEPEPHLCPHCFGELVVLDDESTVCMDCPATVGDVSDLTAPGYLLDSDLELTEPDAVPADPTLLVAPL